LDLEAMPMRSVVAPDFRRDLQHRRSGAGLPGTDDDPFLALVYRIAEVVMDIAGPLFWATLVLGFIKGPLGCDLFQ
jgi:hypothetical protein